MSVFIITVRMFKRTAGKTQDSRSTKTNTFSILGLLFLLGITWAFAFFSYGPMLIPSYYIFTILNSFHGRLQIHMQQFELHPNRLIYFSFGKMFMPCLFFVFVFLQVSSCSSTITIPARLLEMTEAPWSAAVAAWQHWAQLSHLHINKVCICFFKWEGENVLWMRLFWHKRAAFYFI